MITRKTAIEGLKAVLGDDPEAKRDELADADRVNLAERLEGCDASGPPRRSRAAVTDTSLAAYGQCP